MIDFKLKDSNSNIIFELNCISTNVYDLYGDKYFELISELTDSVSLNNYFDKVGASPISVFIDDQETFTGTLFRIIRLVQKDGQHQPLNNKYVILIY